jgi:hypothetical protein
VHATDRLMTIPFRLQSVVQVREACLETLSVLLLRNAIHTDGRVLANTIVGSSQRGDIDEMSERVKSRSGFSFRSLRYL